jgi:hypothetical protein
VRQKYNDFSNMAIDLLNIIKVFLRYSKLSNCGYLKA